MVVARATVAAAVASAETRGHRVPLERLVAVGEEATADWLAGVATAMVASEVLAEVVAAFLSSVHIHSACHTTPLMSGSNTEQQHHECYTGIYWQRWMGRIRRLRARRPVTQ